MRCPWIVVVLLVVTSCTSGPEPALGEPPPPTPSTTSVGSSEPTEGSIAQQAAREVVPEPAPPRTVDLDIEHVVTAAVLIISGGDLEAAITAGLIGEAEAEAAIAALESGSIEHLFGDETESISR